MKRNLVLVMLLVFVFGCVASVWAQGEPTPAQPVKTSTQPVKTSMEKVPLKKGEIASIDTATNMLTLKYSKAGMTEDFKLDPKVVVKKAGKVITVKDLTVGEKVTVVYKEVSGEKIATKIMVGIMHAKKHSEAAKKESEPKTK
jgi:hypothetical protein